MAVRPEYKNLRPIEFDLYFYRKSHPPQIIENVGGYVADCDLIAKGLMEKSQSLHPVGDPDRIEFYEVMNWSGVQVMASGGASSHKPRRKDLVLRQLSRDQVAR